MMQVLEGLRGIRLMGTVGAPPGLATDPRGRVGYVRSAAAAAAAAVSGGSDTLKFVGYDGFRGESAPAPVPASINLKFSSLLRAVVSARDLLIQASSSAVLFPSSAASGLCPPLSCSVYVTARPSRGSLSIRAGGPIISMTAATAIDIPCANEMKGWTTPSALVYTPIPGGGGENYTTVELIMCGPQGKLAQIVRISVACSAGRVADGAGQCIPCKAGTEPSTRGARANCILCPPGHIRPASITTSSITVVNRQNTTNFSLAMIFTTSRPTTTAISTRPFSVSSSSTVLSNLSSTTSTSISEMCHPCPAGTYSDAPGTGVCLPCPPGSYSAGLGAAACAACPVGTYGLGGGEPCVDCGSAAYGPVPGLSACKDCPAGTVTQSRRAQSAAQCECMGGTYLLSALRGESCRPCPVGGYCEGNQLPPVVRDHFWTAPEVIWS
jgi:hypothetical protein